MYKIIYVKVAAWFALFPRSSVAAQIPYALTNMVFSLIYVVCFACLLAMAEDLSLLVRPANSQWLIAFVFACIFLAHWICFDLKLERPDPQRTVDGAEFQRRHSIVLGLILVMPMLLFALTVGIDRAVS